MISGALRNATEGVPYSALPRHGGRALQRGCRTGGNIRFDRRRPQRGFNDSPDSVVFRKSMWQREIDALVIDEAELPGVLADELFDPRAVVIAENDELAFDQNGRDV